MSGKYFIWYWKILLGVHFKFLYSSDDTYEDYSLMFTDVKLVCISSCKSCLFVSRYTYNRSVVHT